MNLGLFHACVHAFISANFGKNWFSGTGDETVPTNHISWDCKMSRNSKKKDNKVCKLV